MIKVLVVEDDPMVRMIYQNYLNSLEGFSLVGEVANGEDALKFVHDKHVDLMLLDLFMPGAGGIQALNAVRAEKKDIDVIMITAAYDGETVKKISHLGIFAYLVKPFSFDSFAHVLQSYKLFFEKTHLDHVGFKQGDICCIFLKGDHHKDRDLPKGLNPITLTKVIQLLREMPQGVCASELGEMLGVSRVTARRYLEYLLCCNRAIMDSEYLKSGRPLNRYRLLV